MRTDERIDKISGKLISLLIAVILGFVAYQSKTWTTDLKAVATSVNELNSQMKVVVQQLAYESQYSKEKNNEQDNLIKDHEVRIRGIERQVK